MNPSLMQALLHKAAPVATRMNDVLQEPDDLREQDTKLMVVAALLYSAGWAQKTQLDLEQFLTLAIHAFGSVQVDKTTPETLQ